MDNEKEILELLLGTFIKMCDFIETSNEIGCSNCPCKEECILKGDKTKFLQFKPVVESIKKKI